MNLNQIQRVVILVYMDHILEILDRTSYTQAQLHVIMDRFQPEPFTHRPEW